MSKHSKMAIIKRGNALILAQHLNARVSRSIFVNVPWEVARYGAEPLPCLANWIHDFLIQNKGHPVPETDRQILEIGQALSNHINDRIIACRIHRMNDQAKYEKEPNASFADVIFKFSLLTTYERYHPPVIGCSISHLRPFLVINFANLPSEELKESGDVSKEMGAGDGRNSEEDGPGDGKEIQNGGAENGQQEPQEKVKKIGEEEKLQVGAENVGLGNENLEKHIEEIGEQLKETDLKDQSDEAEKEQMEQEAGSGKEEEQNHGK
ncbi:Protein CBG27596 [Caenorhabditis briggsae]|uniref:Protein CBG27596 n=2 Tax=Caenorhabditis briggsae TaxID=6238 RepID=B6IKG6_CAEBR|nr:Protein CBG27596 [Caenorhabditis briggsae]CAS00396.1 Protein CBG27596 [Caenorhabditis briggsae]